MNLFKYPNKFTVHVCIKWAVFIRFVSLKITRTDTWLNFLKIFSHLLRFSFHKSKEHYQQTNWLDRDHNMVKVLSQHAITFILTPKKLFMRLENKCLKWCWQSVEKGFDHIICLNTLNHLANTWPFLANINAWAVFIFVSFHFQAQKNVKNVSILNVSILVLYLINVPGTRWLFLWVCGLVSRFSVSVGRTDF